MEMELCKGAVTQCAKGSTSAENNLPAGTSPVWLNGGGYHDSGSHRGSKHFVCPMARCASIFTKKKIRPKIFMAHLHVMLWKAVGQETSPD